MFFQKEIVGGKIILRPYYMDDISAWQKWDIDSGIQKYMPEQQTEPMSAEEQIGYLKECEIDQTGAYWSIVWKENKKLIGTISLTDINKYHGIAELGIVVGETDYWGMGVATEAIKLVLEFVVRQIGLRRVVAEYEEGNLAMGKMLEGVGFNLECVCKSSRIKKGTPINTIRYYILI